MDFDKRTKYDTVSRQPVSQTMPRRVITHGHGRPIRSPSGPRLSVSEPINTSSSSGTSSTQATTSNSSTPSYRTAPIHWYPDLDSDRPGPSHQMVPENVSADEAQTPSEIIRRAFRMNLGIPRIKPESKREWTGFSVSERKRQASYLSLTELLVLQENNLIRPHQMGAILHQRYSKAVQDFGLDAVALDYIFRKHNVILSGSSILSIIFPDEFVPNDLDFYAQESHELAALAFFRSEGYDNQRVIFDTRLYSGSEHVPPKKNLYDRIYKLVNGHGQSINLTISKHKAIIPMFGFHGTMLVNTLNHLGIVITYPAATLNKISILNVHLGKARKATLAAIQKYQDRGWKIIRSDQIGRHLCGSDPYCCRTIRSLHDDNVLFIPFFYTSTFDNELPTAPLRDNLAKQAVWMLESIGRCASFGAVPGGWAMVDGYGTQALTPTSLITALLSSGSQTASNGLQAPSTTASSGVSVSHPLSGLPSSQSASATPLTVTASTIAPAIITSTVAGASAAAAAALPSTTPITAPVGASSTAPTGPNGITPAGVTSQAQAAPNNATPAGSASSATPTGSTSSAIPPIVAAAPTAPAAPIAQAGSTSSTASTTHIGSIASAAQAASTAPAAPVAQAASTAPAAPTAQAASTAPAAPAPAPIQAAPAYTGPTGALVSRLGIHYYICDTIPGQRYYAVTQGFQVGVFRGWANTAPYVTGATGFRLERFNNRDAAIACFLEALRGGNVVVI
ncbi:hypothetical protein BJ165DRAFT_1531814 [Panaeolus papilionaceus]|nr:hypothetical protein BJ165DRAFT_1531814 [Panaeolus papilionaceus]